VFPASEQSTWLKKECWRRPPFPRWTCLARRTLTPRGARRRRRRRRSGRVVCAPWQTCAPRTTSRRRRGASCPPQSSKSPASPKRAKQQGSTVMTQIRRLVRLWPSVFYFCTCSLINTLFLFSLIIHHIIMGVVNNQPTSFAHWMDDPWLVPLFESVMMINILNKNQRHDTIVETLPRYTSCWILLTCLQHHAPLVFKTLEPRYCKWTACKNVAFLADLFYFCSLRNSNFIGSPITNSIKYFNTLI